MQHKQSSHSSGNSEGHKPTHVIPIKVVIGKDGKTLTLLPNPKMHPTTVLLYFLGSSMQQSPLSEEERTLPASAVTFSVDWKNHTNDIIILETKVGDGWQAHFIQVTWREDANGGSAPYLDLKKQWLLEPNCPVIQKPLSAEGRIILKLTIGKGDKALKYSNQITAEGELLASCDLLCRVAIGKMRPLAFQKKVAELLGLTVGEGGEQPNSLAEKVPEYSIDGLMDQVRLLTKEREELKITLDERDHQLREARLEIETGKTGSGQIHSAYGKLQCDYRELVGQKKKLDQDYASLQTQSREVDRCVGEMGDMLFRIWDLIHVKKLFSSPVNAIQTIVDHALGDGTTYAKNPPLSAKYMKLSR